MISKKPLISEIDYFSSDFEEAWEYLKEQSPRFVPTHILGRIALGLKTSVNKRDETLCGRDLISKLRRRVPRGCIQTKKGRGYVFIDGSGEGVFSESIKRVRKKTFLEAAEMVENLYVTCHMPITEIVKHLKITE